MRAAAGRAREARAEAAFPGPDGGLQALPRRFPAPTPGRRSALPGTPAGGHFRQQGRGEAEPGAGRWPRIAIATSGRRWLLATPNQVRRQYLREWPGEWSQETL